MDSFPQTQQQTQHTHVCRDETAALQLAAWLAPRLRPGDIIFLNGDLGAGKTTLARGIIRALCGQDTAVPSPTFTLVQHYEGVVGSILHADLYRLEDVDEVQELDLFSVDGLVLIEWGETLLEDPTFAPFLVNKINIDFHERIEGGEGGRDVTIRAPEDVMKRFCDLAEYSARMADTENFLHAAGHETAKRYPVAGDASGRRYERLMTKDGASVLLMDWPQKQPPSSYAQAVGLGTKTVSFTSVATYLRNLGLAAPEIFQADLENGLLLVEDFGDVTMTHLIDSGSPFLSAVYGEAIAVLAKLYTSSPPTQLEDGVAHHNLPTFGKQILGHELTVFLDWYLPHIGVNLTAQDRADWDTVWATLFDRLEAASLPKVLVLRDFHSPNLIWRNDHQGLARLGLIDVQDALLGSPAYDLVSLLQDARRDVSLEQVQISYAHYLAATGCDPDALSCHYHILGAQRNLRIAGVFARLADRDGRPDYLQHMPRVLGYLKAVLEHQDLQDLKSMLSRYLPDL